MRNTSTFIPNLLTPAQFSLMQHVFERVCEDFHFGLDDKEARDRIAEALMAQAQAGHSLPDAEAAARAKATDIVRERQV
jgi:hypothetical protein